MTVTTATIVDLSNPEFIANPYPLLAQLRAQGSAVWDAGFRSFFSPVIGAWHILSYEGVKTIMQNPAMSSELLPHSVELFSEADGKMAQELVAQHSRNIGVCDPPNHTRLRNFISKDFTLQRLEALRPKLQAIVDELLDAVVDRGQMDITADFSAQLSVATIATIFGFPRADNARLKQWMDDDFGMIGGNITIEQAYLSRQEYIAYLREQVNERRRHPQDDLLTALVQAENEGDRLNDEEIIGVADSVIGAGNETTSSQIGNGWLALFAHPNQLQLLQDNLSLPLLRSAIEEMIRYDTTTQFSHRRAKIDFQLGDKLIKQGEEIFVWLGAANRDPDRFVNPDEFDLTRPDNRHLSFGTGIHRCLGAPLAQLEMEIAFNTMLRRFKNITLAGTPQRMINAWIRGLISLPISFDI